MRGGGRRHTRARAGACEGLSREEHDFRQIPQQRERQALWPEWEQGGPCPCLAGVQTRDRGGGGSKGEKGSDLGTLWETRRQCGLGDSE